MGVADKAKVVTDEWRSLDVEERLAYSLVKVSQSQANHRPITVQGGQKIVCQVPGPAVVNFKDLVDLCCVNHQGGYRSRSENAVHV